MVDALYARLNGRGKKQFKLSGRESFVEHFGPYANLGLPAHKAALDGNVECLKECFCTYMKEGVPSRDVNGATPLHLAARNNHSDAVKWLLRYTDLSVTVTAKHGETPAHVCAAQGHAESLKQLLMADGKGDVKSKLATAVDNSGFSALHLAILKHRNECAKLLISELGAKAVNTLNESGVTSVHLAASAGNVDILRFLGNKYKKLMNQADSEGASPAYYAAQEGRLEVLEYLCEKCKCDVSIACNDGLKPIHAASQCGHTSIIKYILSQLGNNVIFDTTPDGATSLHFATSSEHLHTAQWLINSDAGGLLVKSKDGNGDTPAHDAAENGHVPMLKLLLENGADLYAINNDGNTPYSLALSGGNMDTANYVMTYASKTPQRDSGGPVRIYNMQGGVDVVEVSKPPPEVTAKTSQSEISTGTKEKKSSKKSKEQRKSKTETNGMKKSNSFLGKTSQTLNSFGNSNEESTAQSEDAALDMTEDELAMFNDSTALITNRPAENDIIVRYSVPETSSQSDLELEDGQPEEPGYATVNEIAMMEEKKKKKNKGRKISKSFLKAIKPSGEEKKSKTKPAPSIGGPELGFKPQFHSNPLMKVGGSIPPTPPPTPATAASIAPSDETPPLDVEEADNDGTFATYATPDPEIVKMKTQRRHLEEHNMLKTSENQKLLKDALQDLSGDESPPEVPKQNFRVQTRVSGSQIQNQPKKALRQVSQKSGNEEDDTKSKFPVLKSVKRELPPMKKKTTELSQIKLKKSTDWKRAEYDHPENETASGASEELKKILRKKVVQ